MDNLLKILNFKTQLHIKTAANSRNPLIRLLLFYFIFFSKVELCKSYTAPYTSMQVTGAPVPASLHGIGTAKN